ncbi:hypothetical protein V6N13_080592 [Hibiscus sabdariffa]|uniref:Uncharacterized protein n=1 Tax=Hibiscus sabdariffa TaxID=183260 RepID=A0ABR2APL2_9ROSI
MKNTFLKEFDLNCPQYNYLSQGVIKKTFLKEFDLNRPQYIYQSEDDINTLKKDDQSHDSTNKDEQTQKTKTSIVMDLAKAVL